jgi:iron complex transport system ATP-binding protein
LSLPGRHDRTIALGALERVGIAHLADRPMSQVSGGERQLALIARALAQEPRILLMDEPTANLDMGNQTRVLRTIRALAKDGASILLTTHQPEHALLLQAQVVALAGGRVAFSGPAGSVIRADSVSRLYGTTVDIAMLGDRPVACVPRL